MMQTSSNRWMDTVYYIYAYTYHGVLFGHKKKWSIGDLLQFRLTLKHMPIKKPITRAYILCNSIRMTVWKRAIHRDKSTLVATWAGGQGENGGQEVIAKGYGVSFWGGENPLKLVWSSLHKSVAILHTELYTLNGELYGMWMVSW